MPRFSPARLTAAGIALLAFAVPNAAQAASCANVDVIHARGSGEPPDGWSPLALDGPELQYKNNDTGVWTLIRKELENPTDGSTPIADQRLVDGDGDGQLDPGTVVRTDVVYDASLPWPSIGPNWTIDSAAFRKSVREGLDWTIRYINGRYAACPTTRFVLLGYSQGALLMNNVISPATPSTARLWVDTGAVATLNPLAAGRIAAVATFADAGRRPSDPLAVHATTAFGSSAPAYLQNTKDDLNRGQNDGPASPTSTGPYPRGTAFIAGFKGKVRSYCLDDDMVCEVGPNSNIVRHTMYGDPTKPDRRRNLAIFAIQQLRNEADKTFPVQCEFTSATRPEIIPYGMSLTLRFQASVKDRVASGSTYSTTKMRASIMLHGNQSSQLRYALGDPAAVRRTILNLPVEAKMTLPGISFSETDELLSYNDAIIPLASGAYFTAPIPGGSQAAVNKTADWTVIAQGLNEQKLGSEFDVYFYGQPTGFAAVTCQMPTAAAEFAGRHFGRTVVE